LLRTPQVIRTFGPPRGLAAARARTTERLMEAGCGTPRMTDANQAKVAVG
jgi:hypothetical protein